MPRFFFHVCDGTGFIEDEEGLVLPDLDAARAAALMGARSIMADDLKRGHLDLSSFIEVEDEEGNWLLTLTFDEAVKITTGTQAGRANS